MIVEGYGSTVVGHHGLIGESKVQSGMAFLVVLGTPKNEEIHQNLLRDGAQSHSCQALRPEPQPYATFHPPESFAHSRAKVSTIAQMEPSWMLY